MIYKLCTPHDLARIRIEDPATCQLLQERLNLLSEAYGEERDADHADGGYLLYAEPGTKAEELKACFDYSAHAPEYAELCPNTTPPLCVALYLLNNEFGIEIIVSAEDAPVELIKEI